MIPVLCTLSKDALYLYKFCENVFHGFKLRSRHDFYTEKYKGALFYDNCIWHTVLMLCTLPDYV